MSLPFLKKKNHQVGVMVTHRAPDEPQEADGMEMAAKDVLDAIQAQDPKALASALRAAFEICDSEPHEEGEHTNDYDSMNEKAAKESRE